MDLISYKKKMIPVISACAIFNIGILFLINYLVHYGAGKALFVTLILNVLCNGVFLNYSSRYIALRFNDTLLEKKSNKFLVFVLFASALFVPVWGIYFLYKTFQNIEPNTLNLKQLILFRYIPIIGTTILLIFTIPNGKNERYVPKRILYTLTPAMVNYAADTAFEYKRIFNFNDNIKMICPDEMTRPDCFISKVKERNKEKTLNISEIILYVALDAKEIFNLKTRMAKDENQKIIPAQLILKHNLEMLTFACFRSRPIMKFGIPLTSLFLGNIDLALIEIVDELIHQKLLKTAIPTLAKIAESGNKSADMSEYINMLSEFKNTNCYKRTEF